jgi:heme/copper-type cytochrome/quinol oxidase subunit 2
LHSNAFYVAATGNLGGSSAVLPASTASFRPVSALASPSRATFDTSVIASIVSTVHEHSGFGNAGGLHTNMSESLTSSPSANCSLRAYSYTSSPATAGSWVTIWNYSETQPTYKLSDVREHVSGTSTGYWGLRMGLLLSATMREFTRLQRNLGTSTYDLSPTANLQQYATSAGLVSSKPTYSSNLLSILARNLLDIRQRSAFEPVRSDVGSMKRLRVTKGICLPADYPIHVICGSKDVVHSWAIPGLGIKIDCIPGYNSHRRVLFRWRGIFWGQCMEVCGRYHHWMPILVRIVHRDAFLS